MIYIDPEDRKYLPCSHETFNPAMAPVQPIAKRTRLRFAVVKHVAFQKKLPELRLAQRPFGVMQLLLLETLLLVFHHLFFQALLRTRLGRALQRNVSCYQVVSMGVAIWVSCSFFVDG
jgi:hypothetical protein